MKLQNNTYLTPEQMLPKEGDLVTVQALVGSLIISPEVSKGQNIRMFNDWLKETYEKQYIRIFKK